MYSACVTSVIMQGAVERCARSACGGRSGRPAVPHASDCQPQCRRGGGAHPRVPGLRPLWPGPVRVWGPAAARGGFERSADSGAPGAPTAAGRCAGAALRGFWEQSF